MEKHYRNSHSVYRCLYHLVLTTKYRRKIFNEGLIAYFKERMKDIEEHYPQIRMLKINHEADHVHMLVSIAPQISVGNAVKTIKSISGREMRKKFAFLKKAYWGSDGIWSSSYYVDTIGNNEEAIRRYIDMQGKEDLGQAEFKL